MSHILIVDDEQAVCWALERALTREGHRVAVASSAEEALASAERQRPDAVILDIRLPGMDGLTALDRLRELAPDAPVIVITAFGDLNTAVKALEGGAFDYLSKPFDLDQALGAVARSLQRPAASPSRNGAAAPSLAEPEGIVGRSPAMQVVFKRIALVAPRDACVLITGESGTGKEVVARAIHRHSRRRDRPFLPVHVAALNPGLVESELFGHVKGAFTGATQARTGLLALASGGTIFLDELADIPLAVQVKLLRVLEHGEMYPVGGNHAERLDIRILAATHRDLSYLVSEGHFRHDLVFRLNVFQIHLPPLRERREDVLPLAEYFLERFEPNALPLLPGTIEFLKNQHWLGNVRELRNGLEHAAILARGGPLLPEHFPAPSTRPEGVKASERMAAAVSDWLAERVTREASREPLNLYAEMLDCIEPALLRNVMGRVGGNRLQAARWLGLNRATVRKLLAKYFPSSHVESDKPE